ncbi:threalose-6-phosphate phosphatase [Tulasnella sp. 419]|nr:threalose-6-phosphate phosphatase [Tulasnella sp. 419]
MDSFATGIAGPHPPKHGDPAAVRAAIERLEADHRAKGTVLSGRIIHLCHYLPIVASLQRTPSDIPSPPKTPDAQPVDVQKLQSTKSPASFEWSLTPRRGHTAMHSGVRSLSSTYEQIIVAYTGDVHAHAPGSSSPSVVGGGGAAPGVETIPFNKLTDAEKEALVKETANYKDPSADPTLKSLTYVPVFLDDKVARGHYDGYCKNTLWPLFHYLLWQDVATEITSHEGEFNAYLAANEAFAAKVAEIYQPGDLIWVQDYHLLLAPKLIRNHIAEAHIGLFVHTPFPSSEVFRCLPKRKEILDGMLGANLVCFQTYSYSRHFASSCVRVCGYESAPNGVDVAGQVVSITHCPVGVDAPRVELDAQRSGIKPKIDALKALYQGKKIIVGRDKLDTVKGVVQKLKAFEKLLIDFPQWRGNVVMIQVTSPALTDSPKLERQVSELVAHINGEYGSLDFIPVHHYHQHIKKDEFYALLTVADLALITPLRDGMNTTSMEFVICQNQVAHGKDFPLSRAPSPLVMSEFMGISSTLADGSLQINPWNLGDVAAQINRGLTMSDEEKYQRQEKLYKVVTTHTSSLWASVLVKSLLEKINSEGSAHQTPFLERELLVSKYQKAKKRLFMFDYDGTLTPIVKVPSAAVPSKSTLLALSKLAEDPKNVVYIISGRDSPFLIQHLGHLSKVGFSAEHGCFVRIPGSSEWSNLTKTLDMSWMSEVEGIFKYYTERTTGSFIERKQSSVTWHYRASDPEWGNFQCKQCLDLLETNLVPKRPIEVLVGKKNLEVRPIAVNKGEIVKRLLYENTDSEFVFCAGDDKTDEDMFRALIALRPSGAEAGAKIVLQPPVSASLTATNGGEKPKLEPREIGIEPDAVFSTSVGHSTKKTLAVWHVTSPAEIVESVLELVGEKPIPEDNEDPKL